MRFMTAQNESAALHIRTISVGLVNIEVTRLFVHLVKVRTPFIGVRFLKLCRDFPQKSFIFRSFIRIFAGSYEKISLVHHYLASIRGHCRHSLFICFI